MKKVALLIGVSQYDFDFEPLPATRSDVEALERILRHPDMGGFDQVTSVIDPPTAAELQAQIDALFRDCTRDDLVLLYFSGHGITDEVGALYFTTRQTQRSLAGSISEWTAVSAAFVRSKMDLCKSQRKVVIIDSCFSGAFLSNSKHKKGQDVLNLAQLMGEGRAILTSSSSAETSQGISDSGLSLYTHYLVQGIESGEADFDRDGQIKVEDIHQYVRRHLNQATPPMTPQIRAEQEGDKIVVTQTPPQDAESIYRRQITRLIHQGDVSLRGRKSANTQQLLTLLQRRLRLYPEEAKQIEQEVLKPHQQQHRRCQVYRQAVVKVLGDRRFGDLAQPNNPHRQTLLRLQQELSLSDLDADLIQQSVLASIQHQHRWQRITLMGLSIGTTVCLAATLVLTGRVYANWPLPTPIIAQFNQWHDGLKQTEQQLRLDLAEQIAEQPEEWETLAPFWKAEQTMQQAKAKADWRDAVAPWQQTVNQWQAAIHHSQRLPQTAELSGYRQYLQQRQQQAQQALAYAEAIAPALQAFKLKQRTHLSASERQHLVQFCQQAVTRMATIPPSSPYYPQAQHKLSLYRSWLSRAQRSSPKPVRQTAP
jgi:uncharacterized caspase-like protein